MRAIFLSGLALAITAGITLPLAGAAEAAIGGALPSTEILPVENVQFFFGGRNYCWYDGGWRGPGWYWCGYAWHRGFGWGGGEGWRGWRRGARGEHGARDRFGFHVHVGGAGHFRVGGDHRGHDGGGRRGHFGGAGHADHGGRGEKRQ